MTTLFLVLQVVFAVIITISVLLQKSSSIGLGAYSGSNESLFGAKGPAGFLAKFTFVVGILFILNTLALSYVYNTQSSKSLIDSIDTSSLPAAPEAVVPQVPNAPAAPEAPVSEQK